jgi:hypothetical protein
MGEERSSEFHLASPNDGKIISKELHLRCKDLTPFSQILIEAPSVFDLGDEII